MNPDDVVFLLVVLAPLFAAQWRASLLGLAAQGVLLWRASGAAGGFDAVDLLLLRGLVAPVLLWRVYKGSDRNDVIPASLFGWGSVGALTLAAFAFAAALDGGATGGRTAAATAALLLGFFVLASQDGVFSQLVGVLRIENAVALFELTLPRDHPDPVVRCAQVAATAGATLLAAWYLRELRGASPPAPEAP